MRSSISQSSLIAPLKLSWNANKSIINIFMVCVDILPVGFHSRAQTLKFCQATAGNAQNSALLGISFWVGCIQGTCPLFIPAPWLNFKLGKMAGSSWVLLSAHFSKPKVLPTLGWILISALRVNPLHLYSFAMSANSFKGTWATPSGVQGAYGMPGIEPSCTAYKYPILCAMSLWPQNIYLAYCN